MLKLEDLKQEATKLVADLKEADDDEHAVAKAHIALVLAYKSGEEARTALTGMKPA